VANHTLNSTWRNGEVWFQTVGWIVFSSNSTVITLQNADGTSTQLIGMLSYVDCVLKLRPETILRHLAPTFSIEYERIDGLSVDAFDLVDAIYASDPGSFLLSGNDTVTDNFGGAVGLSEATTPSMLGHIDKWRSQRQKWVRLSEPVPGRMNSKI
jgi:hypothetical protein